MSKRRRPQSQKTDPLAVARQAMVDVLERARASRDDDRILAAAKSVLAHATKEPGPTQTDEDLDIETLTLPEKKELHDIIVAVKVLKNKVRARQGRELLPIPEPFKEPEPPRVLPPQWYPPQPAPRPKVEAEDAEAPASKPIEVDPLDDYIAGEESVVFGPPMEVE